MRKFFIYSSLFIFLFPLFLIHSQTNTTNTCSQLFALGDSLAGMYAGRPDKFHYNSSGDKVWDIDSGESFYYKVGAQSDKILDFATDQTKLDLVKVDYIKRYGVVIFSGTNSPTQGAVDDVYKTIDHLVKLGVPPNKIYLSTILNSVPGSQNFNPRIIALGGQIFSGPSGEGKITIVRIEDLEHAIGDNLHPRYSNRLRDRVQSACNQTSSQLPNPTENPPAPSAPSQTPSQTSTFNKNLGYGSSGPDVIALQNFLINNGYSISAGATGNYRNQTQLALAQLQKDALNTYYTGNTNNQFLYGLGQALNNQGYTPGDMNGYLGDTTRNYLNNQIASGHTTFQPYSNPNLYGGLPVQQVQDYLLSQGYTLPSNELGVGGPVTQSLYNNQITNGTPSPLPSIPSFSTGGTQGGLPYNANQSAYPPGVNPATQPAAPANLPSVSGCNHPSSISSGGRTYNVRITSYVPGEPGSTGNTALTGENLANYHVWGSNTPYACTNFGMAAVDSQMIATSSLIAVLAPDGKYYFYKAGDKGGDVTRRKTSKIANILNTNNPRETCLHNNSREISLYGYNICQFLPVVDLFMSTNINPYNTQIVVYPPGTY